MGQSIEASRAKLLAIPNAVAATVADLSDPEACRSVLDEVCREAAQTLADFDPIAVSGKLGDLSKEATEDAPEESAEVEATGEE